MKKYGFTLYMDKTKPVVFFGLYGILAKNQCMNNTSLVVIVWSGSDSLRLHEHTDFVAWCKRNEHRVFHIAHSWWIQKDLEHFGLKYIDRVVLPADLSRFKFEPGHENKVYHYGNKDRLWYYGTDVMQKIRQKWEKNRLAPKVEIVTSIWGYRQDELYEIYKRAFIGVRLTEHDNMALTVLEMALMGRPSIFNGNVPGAIPFDNARETYTYNKEIRKQRISEVSAFRVIDLITWSNREPSKLLAEEAREFVEDDEKWLDTKFYE